MAQISSQHYSELIEAFVARISPQDALYHLLQFLEHHIPFDTALIFYQDRAQLYSQVLLEYSKKGIQHTNRVFRTQFYRTPVGRNFFGQDYQDIYTVHNIHHLEGAPKDLLRMGYKHRASQVIMLHVDEEDTLLMALALIAHDEGVFNNVHAGFLSALRGPLALATKPFFLSHSDELILLGPEGSLPSSSDGLLRRCPDLAPMMALLDVVAPTESTVLILGPTGSGKGITAEAIHQLSPRNRSPFIQVNCASIPESLLESELFGFEKGSFTGAQASHKGYFEQAHQGTLFLDEVGELTLSAQAKLLHVLEKREIVRVGGERRIPVDVRIVSATHKNLAHMVGSGAFREDLYYRLNVFPLAVPPLSARKADIPVLAEYFYHILTAKKGDKFFARLSKEGLRTLTKQEWPGNVRQLSHTIERALLISMARGDGVVRFDANVLQNGLSNTNLRNSAHRQNFKDEILAALEKSQWRIQGSNGAAEILKLSPATLRSRMKTLGILLPRQRS